MFTVSEIFKGKYFALILENATNDLQAKYVDSTSNRSDFWERVLPCGKSNTLVLVNNRFDNSCNVL